ncbi:hypothetical protein SO694_00002762 [Aureococcus anophagefferens]|uniref:Uncharacterized protein n=1 Tax=Aureococcus anophagefferens TaxID=44056 RepID=A0ABR1GD79_AURAN
MAPAEYLSGAWRLGLAAGYAALLAVNGIYGSGAFGVPTNADISGAYPSPVTPAGFTFAIWGPIFLLQGGGTALAVAGRAPGAGGAAAARPRARGLPTRSATPRTTAGSSSPSSPRRPSPGPRARPRPGKAPAAEPLKVEEDDAPKNAARRPPFLRP